MSHYLDMQARFTLAVIGLCGVVLVPLLALSPPDATVAAVAWLGGVALSYLAVRSVTASKRPTEDAESNTAD